MASCEKTVSIWAIVHARAAPPNLRERQLASADTYAEQLVDTVLTAFRPDQR
ncbi:hypothetical protein IU483_25545 [Streptomyces gardneri]|nr:hypothetical protein [Streptomyces gardneri]